MAKILSAKPEPTKVFDGADVEDVIGRLADAVRAMDRMGKDERSAALAYLKGRYRAEWPSDSNY